MDLGDDNQPSAAIRSMWDSVVSWMKVAVDFIATEEAVPAATPSPSTRRKVGQCMVWIAKIGILTLYTTLHHWMNNQSSCIYSCYVKIVQ